MKEYLEKSARTVSEAMHYELVDPNQMGDKLFESFQSKALDRMKKALYYGKEKYDYREGNSDLGYTYDGVDVDLMHGILGVYTEAQELTEVLHSMMLNDNSIDHKAKIIDESGDVLWYLALLFRKLGTSFEEVAEKNIAKLYARYPEKFDADLAVNRNEEKEQAVFD